MNEILETQIEHKREAAERARDRRDGWSDVEDAFRSEQYALEKQKARFEQGTVLRNKLFDTTYYDSVIREINSLQIKIKFIEHNKAMSKDDYEAFARNVYSAKLACLRLDKEL